MIITRWQAPILPTIEQIKLLMSSEGYDFVEETLQMGVKVPEHRHAFVEVRYILKGQLLVSVSGNQFLLREGDRVEIAGNTKHWHSNTGEKECICIVAQKPI